MEELRPVLSVVAPTSFLVFFVILIGVGIYGATRREGRGDVLRGHGVQLALIVLMGLASVLPTEIVSIMWLTSLQRGFEITANLFVLVPLPIIAVMVALQGIVLARLYRSRPLLHGAVYLGVFAVAYASWLTRLFNPPGDVARYVVIILFVGGIVLSLVSRLVWQRRARVDGDA